VFRIQSSPSFAAAAKQSLQQIHKDSDLRSLAPAVAALLLAAVVMFDPRVFNDGDTYWHLATGQWILAHHRVPQVDVFSFSRPGAPWVAHEWLSELLMALAWRADGWSGVVVLFAAAAATAAWLMVRRLSGAIGGVTLILTASLALACMSGSLLARPHLLALPVVIIWVLELMSARSENRAPRLVFALLMMLWANLHGSFVMGFLIAGAFGLEALVQAEPGDRFKVVRDWGIFGAASLVAAMITPYGVEGFIYPFQIMSMSSLPGIVEWRPTDFSKLSTFEIGLLTTMFVCLHRGVRVPIVRLILLLGLLYLALQHIRHQMVLAAVAPLILADPLALALGHQPRKTRLHGVFPLAFGAVAVLLVGSRLFAPIIRTDGVNSPVTAVAQLPPDLAGQPVMNDYGFGGYLIFKGVKPFIDGRSDMYGDAFTQAYFAAMGADRAGLDRFLDKHGVVWTIFAPGDPVVAVLDRDPSWVRIHSDGVAVVHRRVAATAPINAPPTSLH
jgi:hypothetical protein